MIAIRTKEEIQLLKEAGRLLGIVKQVVFDAIQVGMTTLTIDQIAHDKIIELKAKPAFLGYGGFPGTVCISINEELIHGIPSKRVICDGDVVKVDLGLIWKGYFSDSAFTKGVGKISVSDEKLISVAKNAFYAGVEAIQPGARLGDIEFAIGNYIAQNNMFTPKEYSGHGVGTSLHEEPYVHNSGIKGTGPLLKDGMVLAIEPMIVQKSANIKVLSDGWTVVAASGEKAAHYEHTICIEDGCATILTGGI